MSEINLQTRIDGGEVGVFYNTGGVDAAFVAVWGETTEEELRAAISNGKMIMIKSASGVSVPFFFAANSGYVGIQCAELIQGGLFYREVTVKGSEWSCLEWYVQGSPWEG